MSRMHIHVGGSFADDARRILAATQRAEAGEPVEPEAHISFQDWETFFRILTPTRIALLRHECSGLVPGDRSRLSARPWRRRGDGGGRPDRAARNGAGNRVGWV